MPIKICIKNASSVLTFPDDKNLSNANMTFQMILGEECDTFLFPTALRPYCRWRRIAKSYHKSSNIQKTEENFELTFVDVGSVFLKTGYKLM